MVHNTGAYWRGVNTFEEVSTELACHLLLVQKSEGSRPPQLPQNIMRHFTL